MNNVASSNKIILRGATLMKITYVGPSEEISQIRNLVKIYFQNLFP